MQMIILSERCHTHVFSWAVWERTHPFSHLCMNGHSSGLVPLCIPTAPQLCQVREPPCLSLPSPWLLTQYLTESGFLWLRICPSIKWSTLSLWGRLLFIIKCCTSILGHGRTWRPGGLGICFVNRLEIPLEAAQFRHLSSKALEEKNGSFWDTRCSCHL